MLGKAVKRRLLQGFAFVVIDDVRQRGRDRPMSPVDLRADETVHGVDARKDRDQASLRRFDIGAGALLDGWRVGRHVVAAGCLSIAVFAFFCAASYARANQLNSGLLVTRRRRLAKASRMS